MRLTKESQYSILFTLYLARAGRATVDVAAKNLNISRHYLQQIARRLSRKAITRSVRGPGGGYELYDNIRLIDVLNSVDGNGLLTSEERKSYMTSGILEERALEHYVSNLGLSMWPILNKSIRVIMQELVTNEVTQLNNLPSLGLEQ